MPSGTIASLMPGYRPSALSTSLKLRPVARTSISTCPAAGGSRSTGTNCSASNEPACVMRSWNGPRGIASVRRVRLSRSANRSTSCARAGRRIACRRGRRLRRPCCRILKFVRQRVAASARIAANRSRIEIDEPRPQVGQFHRRNAAEADQRRLLDGDRRRIRHVRRSNGLRTGRHEPQRRRLRERRARQCANELQRAAAAQCARSPCRDGSFGIDIQRPQMHDARARPFRRDELPRRSARR